jgi:3-deoxy-D-manno-octulosonic-acid transferase
MIVRLFRILRTPLPLIRFFVNEGESISYRRLSSVFGRDQVMFSGNPRWERVRRRLVRSEGIGEWRERIDRLSHPVVMVGSAWEEDLEFLIPVFEKMKGSMVVVPHRLDAESLQSMSALLESRLPGRFLLIPVMGILVELYPLADRAFVGGGFGKGVHSTLEPAVARVPTACGPERVERFPETHELRRRGALVVCSSVAELSRWLEAEEPGRLTDADLQNLVSGYHRLLEQCL